METIAGEPAGEGTKIAWSSEKLAERTAILAPRQTVRIRSIEKTGALILGGVHGSLAAIRSFGRRRIPVWHLTDGNLLSRFSHYATRFAAWPGCEDPGALQFLLEHARSHDLTGWVLIPGGDAEARFVAENHSAFA